jgi:hypothetical protein
MGFFSDIMKNPLVQMALPMALSYFMPGIGGLIGTSAISNPMMRSAAEQALLGYGTAALTGSKHPEKAAMYAGLGSMPFSFMKAQGAANQFNKQYYGDVDAKNLFKTAQGPKIMSEGIPGYWDEPSSDWIKAIEPKWTGDYGNFKVPDAVAAQAFRDQGPMTAWDVLGGKGRNVPEMRDTRFTGDFGEPIWNEKAERFAWPDERAWDASGATIGGEMITPEVDFYSKIGKGQKNLLGQELTKGETFTDWTPTIASQTAGWYGGRPTEEEEWEDAKARRRKELAFMYGIDESLMGGELENPYYGGGGFWKDGGIAALQMDAGGAVNGPGGPKDDVIDAKLSDGEFVMTAKAVENLGGGDRMAGAKQMYNMMNQLDPQSETVQESVIGVS